MKESPQEVKKQRGRGVPSRNEPQDEPTAATLAKSDRLAAR